MRTDTRWLKSWRDLGQHRARSLLVVLAVALGLVAAGTVLNAWALVERATELGYRASLPASATLVLDRADAQALALARAEPGVAAARLRRSVMGTLQAGGRLRKAVLTAVDNPQQTDIARLQAEVGPWPPAEGQLWIEHSSLDFSGASLGEALTVQLAGQAGQAGHTLPLSGQLRDVSLAPGWMENLVYLFVSPATLASLGAPAGFNELQIRLARTDLTREAVRAAVATLQHRLEAAGYRVSKVEVPEPGEHIHAAQMDSLMLTQGAFGLLALGACAFLVVNLVAAMLTGQTREIGVMKVLGGSARQIGAMVLAQAGLLGLLATVLAMPLALWLGRLYGGFKGELLNFPVTPYAVPLWSLALQAAVGLLLPVLAAAVPVRAALRASVGEALRDTGITAEGQPLTARRGALAARAAQHLGGWARPLMLSVGNAFRRRQRMVLTLLALAIGGAVYLGAANLRAAVRGSVDQLFEAQAYQLQLRVAEAAPASQLEALARETAGVADAQAWRGARAQPTAPQSEAISLLGLPLPARLLRPTPLEGRWLADGATAELVVTRLLQRQQPQWQVGSRHRLEVAGQVREWTVVGMVDGGPQALAFTSRQTLERLAGDTLATSLAVRLTAPDSPVALLEAAAQLRSRFAEAGLSVAATQSQAESRRVVEDHLLMVVDFLGAMGWVMMAVGAMGLASTMGLAVLERQREIGVMRTLGAGNGALFAMVQLEGLTFVALSWLIALPLAAPLSAALELAFGRIMFSVPWRLWPTPGVALGWLALMSGIALLGCALPARRAMRVTVAKALAYA